MRKLDRVFVAAGILSLSVLIAVSSCDDGDAGVKEDAKPTRQHVASALQSSHWSITHFFNQQDKTDEFIGFSLTFQEDGTVQVVRNNVSVMGSWSSFRSPQDEIKLNLEFMPVQSMSVLNSDWVIVSQTDNLIKLEDVSQQQELTLERI